MKKVLGWVLILLSTIAYIHYGIIMAGIILFLLVHLIVFGLVGFVALIVWLLE